jgi:PHD/YefM family antitoxin component YafN of YafNO toxin-antitoxin module
METTFRLKASELSEDLVKTIKRLYKKHDLFITVKNADEMDETDYLLSSEANRKALEKSLKNVEEGKLIEVDIKKYLKK